jgi:hypothetical protein
LSTNGFGCSIVWQDDLHAVCPGLLEITNDAGNLWFLNFLTSTDNLPKLAGLRRSSLLKIHGVGIKYAGLIQAWQKRAQFSPEVKWTGEMILEDATRILELHAKIKALEVKMEAVPHRYPTVIPARFWSRQHYGASRGNRHHRTLRNRK